ncbi:LuxR family transcriptional regulator [Pseudactinotalea sp. HY158]|uniref:helix-turn-helix transcriptional regulator n=1 Tax=Pseudactinotalea sp. HY158 TaxID=2654547 RepID=UPI00129C7C18|nr:LuxR family transcriptional regulator [Pseudactinotalea sp. HY158]QGH69731.1 AAA family ATPase [Pseudactinotalea sp. HY158]
MRDRGRGDADGAVVRALPLVGRAAELGRIQAALARAAAGDPVAVVLSGPPGIGTSRLGEEALTLARRAGFLTGIGRADEAGDDLAYAPVVSLFGGLLRAVPPPERASLLRGLDQLAPVIAGLGAPRPLDDPALERLRIVDGLTRLTDRLTRRAPLALLIDDAHALDPESAAFLAHLAVTIEGRRLLLVVTTRADEPHHTRSVRLLARLAAGTWSQEHLRLEALTDSESRRLLTGALGPPVDPELTVRVLEACAGVPLLLTAVAADLRSSDPPRLAGSGAPLPGDLRARLAVRLAGLTDDERHLLELLALAGTHPGHAVLAAAARPDSGARAPFSTPLDELLERLERRLLVVTGDDGASRLAHGLLREALVAEMVPATRRRRHGELARALRAHDPDDPRIADHLLRSGSLTDPAVVIGAARRARDLGAIDEAARYLRAARDLSPDSEQAGLLVELGDLALQAGRRDEAVAQWRAALRHSRRRGDAGGITRAHRKLALLAWGDGEGAVAADHFEAATRAQAGLEPSRELAEVLYSRMLVAVRDGDVAIVPELADRLRPIAARLHDPGLRIRLWLVEAAGDTLARDLGAARTGNTRALDLARATGDPVLEARALDQLSVIASIAGDIPELRRRSTAGLEIGESLGVETMAVWPRMRLILADLLGGNWDRALGMHAWLLVLRGSLPEADGLLARARALQARSTRGEPRPSIAVCTAGAALALARGNPREAARVGAPLADLTASWYPFAPALVLGEALAVTDPAAAAALADQVRAWSCGTAFPAAVAAGIDAACLPIPAPGSPAGHPDRSTLDRAQALLRGSIDGFDALGLPFLAARARLDLARWTHAGADSPAEEAGHLAGDALAVFSQLGARDHARRARALVHDLDPLAAESRGGPPGPGPASAEPVRLSRRELEVARLVAEGRTNAEVATALFISPRTVTSHLDHVYQRLGLGSRAALTRYLADSGLLGRSNGSNGSIT